jgi:hypothetical protein
MVSNTIQCEFESHPGHTPGAVGGHPHDGGMYSLDVRHRALDLLGAGESLSSVSRAMGVARSTLRDWRATPMPRTPYSECPVCGHAPLDRIAYAALLGFYLGDGCVSAHARYFSLRVSCDARLPAIIEDVCDVLHRVHPARTVFRVPAPGAVVVQSHWKHWPCLFPQHGPGRKHERPIVLQDWQRLIVEEHPGGFLRGLFHSDGSRTRNWATRVVAGAKKRYDYPRWEFVNRSDDILGLCTWALDLCDIAWRRPRINAIAVSRHDDVRRLDALIGPKA